jgi:hypothetical protein
MRRSQKKNVTRNGRPFELVEAMPDLFGHGDPLPTQLVGATIRRIGTMPTRQQKCEGCLVIEYSPHLSDERFRIIFAFNDRAMWIYSDEPIA